MEELQSEHLSPPGRWTWCLKSKPVVPSVLQMKVWSFIHDKAESFRELFIADIWVVKWYPGMHAVLGLSVWAWNWSQISVLLSPPPPPFFLNSCSDSSRAFFHYTCDLDYSKGHTACVQIYSKRPQHLHLAQIKPSDHSALGSEQHWRQILLLFEQWHRIYTKKLGNRKRVSLRINIACKQK